MSKASEAIEDKAEKMDDMARLLIECRDALPAISETSRRLRGISPTLADRIDSALEPWAVPDDTPGAIYPHDLPHPLAPDERTHFVGRLKAKLVSAWCWIVGHDLMSWTGEDRNGWKFWEHECLRCFRSWGGP